MIKKIWRYSHLYLAVSSSLFLLLAAVTGVILAVEPIQQQLNYGHAEDISNVTLAEILPKIKGEYDEIFELKRSEDDLIYVSALQVEKDIDGDFIIDLETGKAIQELPQQSEFFAFITSLHRSLFLKNTGRWLVGINSLFLFLMVVTGFMLILKRQHGLKNLFKKVIRLDFPSYSHTYLGRLMLLPLGIISLSAVCLFMIRFEYLPNAQDEIITYPIDANLSTKNIDEFEVFKSITLNDINSVEFPFSEFEEDYFILNLKNKTLHIHQYTGQILEEVPSENLTALHDLSYFLHTGKGSIFWSVVLGISGLSVLYFIYSGFLMARPRFRRKTSNTFTADEAEIIVLYGSETGSTQYIAQQFFKSLLKAEQKAYITSLNQYRSYPSMKNLVIFTSTHGKGEAPHNAFYFLDKFKEFDNPQEIEYAILGFGSTHYPDFCAFAKQVDDAIKSKENFKEQLPLMLVDNQSSKTVKDWWHKWNLATKIKTIIPSQLQEQHTLSNFEIKSKNIVDDGFGKTFTLQLELDKHIEFESGDLLGIFPPDEIVERFYSIAKLDEKLLLLSIKIHPYGVCSQYLSQLEIGDLVKAYIKSNSKFHLELSAPSITFISNGTGVAPYIGMIDKYAGEIYFYWGGRNKRSWELYAPFIQTGNFNEIEMSFSREENENKYIQHLIQKRQAILFYRLQAGGIIMICGSMQMQEDVFEILDNYADAHNLPKMEYWLRQGQIKLDTY